MSYSVGAQNGMTIDLAAGSNRGTGSGSDSTNVNTYVTATNTATIKSGGNTTLAGAVVQAEAVKAEVGGDLRIQSQQDTSTATANQSGGGFDASICYFWCYGTPVVAGGSVSTAGGKGQYASVTEQSGIQAGDGGFDVKVVGNTNLVGGVIASTDQAVDGAKNSFTTGSLTMSDVVNVDTFNASGYSVSGICSSWECCNQRSLVGTTTARQPEETRPIRRMGRRRMGRVRRRMGMIRTRPVTARSIRMGKCLGKTVPAPRASLGITVQECGLTWKILIQVSVRGKYISRLVAINIILMSIR